MQYKELIDLLKFIKYFILILSKIFPINKKIIIILEKSIKLEHKYSQQIPET